jgi:hypothetical protein
MSDEGQGGNWVVPFVLGMIVGILLTLGAGGVLLTNQYRRAALEAERAAMEAERARAAEMEAREEALRALEAAEAHRKAEKDQQDAEKKARTKGP